MRINPNPTSDILAAIWETQSQEQTALEQLSTGRRVNRPSDGAAESAIEVQNQAQEARIDQYLQSVGSLQARFQTADSSLSTVVTSLNRAITLGTQAGNGTLSSTNQQQIAQELQGILDSVVQAANTTFPWTFIFAGTATTQPPFTATGTTVTYNGNSGVNTVAIADGRNLQANLPGDQIFQNAAGDVMGSLGQLITAVQSGNAASIAGATSAVSTALNQVNAQRVFYGNALGQLDSDETTLNQLNLNLKAQDTSLVGADPTKAATDLSQAQTAHQAALAAAAQILPLSLLDYLK